MDICDESFPEDDIFQSFTTCVDEIISIRNNESISSSSSMIKNQEPISLSSTLTGPISSISDQSSIEKLNDSKESSVEADVDAAEVKVISFKNKFEKSQSYQDLHSNYTKNKYRHVKSKVRQYIANIKAQERNNHKTKAVSRHNSFPSTFNRNIQINYDDLSGPKSLEIDNYSNNNDDFGSILIEKEKEIEYLKKSYEDLKNLNEYLQSNYDEKSAQAAKYIRIAETVQIELFNLKEREKHRQFDLNRRQYNPRNSLPGPYLFYNRGKTSTATQTNEKEISLNALSPTKSLALKTPNRIDEYFKFTDTLDLLKSGGDGQRLAGAKRNCLSPFQLDEVNGNKLRRRSDSGSTKNNSIKRYSGNSTDFANADSSLAVPTSSRRQKTNGSDSAIEIEHESDEILLRNNLTENLFTPALNKSSKLKKKKRMRKGRKWNFFFGFCNKCRKNENSFEDYSYTQMPLADTMFNFNEN